MATGNRECGASSVKVVYVAGAGRSGSTLLDNILGELEGFTSTGELRLVWDAGRGWRYPCGCGTPVRECSYWQRAFEHADITDFAHFAALERETLRTRKAWRLIGRIRPGARWTTALDSLAAATERLYRAIASETGSHVVVDSSKSPLGLALLSRMTTIEPFVVHLVRDPRAVAYSWLRRRTNEEEGRRRLDRRGVVHSSSEWLLTNAAVEVAARRFLLRRVLVRYEDFVAAPGRVVEQVCELVGEGPRTDRVLLGSRVRLGVSHTAAGNPSRFRTGEIELRADDEWVDHLARLHRALVSLVSLPLRPRYGYGPGRQRDDNSQPPLSSTR